jgi:hypothetical protein
MKKLIKTIALTLFASSLSLSSIANPDLRTIKEKSFEVGMYYDSSSGTIKTFIEKQKGVRLKVIFQDKNGVELSHAYANKNSKVIKIYFDINTLPNGMYNIKVTNGLDETNRSGEISQPKPTKKVKFDK